MKCQTLKHGMENTVVIGYVCKLEKGTKKPILFMPSMEVNQGNIGYFSPLDGHGEASLKYYTKGTLSPNGYNVERVVHNYAQYLSCLGQYRGKTIIMKPLHQIRRAKIGK